MSLQYLWAKKGSVGHHPLICHMIDTASVVEAMGRLGPCKSLKRHIAEQFRVDNETAGGLLAFLAGLHDIGKACPGFQAKDPEIETVFSTVWVSRATKRNAA